MSQAEPHHAEATENFLPLEFLPFKRFGVASHVLVFTRQGVVTLIVQYRFKSGRSLRNFGHRLHVRRPFTPRVGGGVLREHPRQRLQNGVRRQVTDYHRFGFLRKDVFAKPESGCKTGDQEKANYYKNLISVN